MMKLLGGMLSYLAAFKKSRADRLLLPLPAGVHRPPGQDTCLQSVCAENPGSRRGNYLKESLYEIKQPATSAVSEPAWKMLCFSCED